MRSWETYSLSFASENKERTSKANNMGFVGLFASYFIGLTIFSMNVTSSADKPYLR